MTAAVLPIPLPLPAPAAAAAVGAVRVGLVGAGAIAQAYLKALEGLGDARLVAIADTRAEAARAVAEGGRCAAFAGHEAMADAGGCDAVVVCTPPSTHGAIGRHFLERGIPVLCEKPLSTDVASALALKAAAERHGTLLTMASKFRYVDDVIRAKAIVASGILGDIVEVENVFSARVDMTRRWNADRAVGGGGVLIDNGTHSVDILRYLAGPIVQVLAVEERRAQDVAVEDTVHLLTRTADGITGKVDLSWSLTKELDSYINIHGTRGTVRVGWRESRYRQSSGGDWVVFGRGYDKIAAFRRQLENFLGAIRGREPLLITLDDAIASVEVIQAAYASLRRGRWVTVAPVDTPTVPQ